MANPRLIMENNITVEIYNDDTGQLLGFGFAEPETGDIAQVQRFLMFTRDLYGQSFPTNRARIVRCTHPDWKDITTTGDFTELASRWFVPNRDVYIKCHCRLYTDATLSLPDDSNQALYPPGAGEPQGYWGTAPILNGGVLVGTVFIRVPDTSRTAEYWALGPAYNTVSNIHLARVGSWQDVTGADYAKLVDGRLWLTAAGTFDRTMALVTCRHYTAFPQA